MVNTEIRLIILFAAKDGEAIQSAETQRRQWHPLQYSCLENPMDRGAWWAAVHGVAEGQTRLSDFNFSLCHLSTWPYYKHLDLCFYIRIHIPPDAGKIITIISLFHSLITRTMIPSLSHSAIVTSAC